MHTNISEKVYNIEQEKEAAVQSERGCGDCVHKEKENTILKKQVDDLNKLLEMAYTIHKEEFETVNKELEKIKKDKIKVVKDHGNEMKEIKEQLSRSFAEIKVFTEANTKLLEEKKTLLGIHKVNIDLQEELKRNKNTKPVDIDEVTITDCEDDDFDEESVV